MVFKETGYTMLFRSISLSLSALFCALIAFVTTGQADIYVTRFGDMGMIFAVCAALLCAAVLIAKQKRIRFLSLSWTVWLACFLSICSVRYFGQCASAYLGSTVPYGFSPMYLCYYAVILLFSMAVPRLWFVSVLVFILSELASLWFAGFFHGFFIYPSKGWHFLLFNRLSVCAQPFELMTLSAVLPYIIGRLNPATAQNRPAAPAAVSLPKPDDGFNQKTALLQQDLMPVSSKTQAFLLEQDAAALNKSDVNELLSSVVYFMSRNFKAYSAIGFVYDPLKRVFVLNSFHSKNYSIVKGTEIPIGRGVVGKVGVEKRSFLSGDVSLYHEELLYYKSHESINSVLCVPILSEAKELLGALCIDNQDKNSFTEQHKETLLRFSSLAAALITNVRMRIFQERAAKSFQIFYESSQQFITALRAEQVFDVLFKMTGLLTPLTRLMLITFDEQRRCGVIGKITGAPRELTEGTEFPINAGIYSYAFQKRTIVNISNFQLYRGKYYRFIETESFNPAIASLLIVPLFDDEQRIVGLISCESDIVNQFTQDTEKHLSILIGNASVAITRARLYQKMETLASTDGLTQLNNHRTFQEHLVRETERSKRHGRPLSLLLMDIDHFKHFNDTYGHPVGDLVLKEISACIKQSVRLNDIPARYGGEEFTVIIPDTSEEGAMVIAERIRNTVERKIIMSLDRPLRVTISLGCATMPLHAQNGPDLIDCADKALYYSKEHGRNKASLYVKGMTSEKKKG